MTAADLLSLARIPLGVAFVIVAADVKAAFFVLAAAALTDVLDGWVARRTAPTVAAVPHRGDWLDPLCDKLFALAVVIGLLYAHEPPLTFLLLLLAREQLQLIAVVLMRLLPTLRQAAKQFEYRAHPVGKATTVAQFTACAALLTDHVTAGPLCGLAALLGVISFGIYVQRIRSVLPRQGPPSPAA
ncbi:MAG TPA: CDP-alcohol phosphatidyltransferase family protein [Polyangia bacterium]